jgi:1,4-alpha-glucan branching enzyme
MDPARRAPDQEKGHPMPSKKPESKKQTFSFTAPKAANVLLAGDFTGWQDRPVPMKKRPRGLWQVTVALPPGRYHYRFIVDGEWRDDPECTLRVPNVFGSENAVRQVT